MNGRPAPNAKSSNKKEDLPTRHTRPRRTREIRIAIVGVGNCASSLVQGLHFYGSNGHRQPAGLLNLQVDGYRPDHIRVTAAFDIDARKVGRPIEEAIFAPPNCTLKFCANGLPRSGVTVQMGELLDGVADHMARYSKDRTFVPAKQRSVNVAKRLRDAGVEILLNYLPVGSEQATAFYAEQCLAAGVSLINCMPVFIVSNPRWAARFTRRGIPVIGDDIKSQLGATILHRALVKLFQSRGVTIERTYQLNTGGNTDFLNMLNQERLASKKISKTEAVQSLLPKRLRETDIHIGPSDYVPWQRDRKVCFLRIEGRGFGDCPIEIELRLSVEDSPNSAGMTIDAIRCLRMARDRGLRGPIQSVSAWTMKHPPVPMGDDQARRLVEAFIQGTGNR